MTKEQWRKIFALITGILAVIGTVYGLTACNVSRQVTTQSSYITHGDTTTTIVTKTIETYDASKKY